jgi:hypothetical protein
MKRSWLGELNSPPHTYMNDLWMKAWCAQRGPGLQQQHAAATPSWGLGAVAQAEQIHGIDTYMENARQQSPLFYRAFTAAAASAAHMCIECIPTEMCASGAI